MRENEREATDADHEKRQGHFFPMFVGHEITDQKSDYPRQKPVEQLMLQIKITVVELRLSERRRRRREHGEAEHHERENDRKKKIIRFGPAFLMAPVGHALSFRGMAERLAGKYVLEFAVFYRDPAVHDRKFEFAALETNKVREIAFLDLAASTQGRTRAPGLW